MRTEKDKIKDIFSSKFENFEPDIPQDMWGKIAQGLPDEVIPMQAKKIPLFRRLAIISTAAAVVVVCLLALLNTGKQDDVKKITEDIPVEALVPVLTDHKDFKAEIKEDATEEVINTSSTSTRLIASAYSPKSVIENYNNTSLPTENANTVENSIPQDKELNNTAVDDNKPATVDKAVMDAKIKEFASQSKNAEDALMKHSSNIPAKKEKSGFSFSLGGNAGFSKDNNNKVELPNSLRNVQAYYDESVMDMQTELPAENNEVSGKMDHTQPVSFGIMVSKDLNSKFTIETGVVYTYLSSKIKNQQNSNLKRSDSQYFHYLGVPVSLNYNFAKLEKAEFFISAGGMIQKDFYGRYKEDQIMINNKQEKDSRVTEKRKIHQSNPQFSMMGKVGASYPIYNKMHVYATVGGAYYFDAENKYKTIYTDRQFQLDLNVGIKFKF